ncbi:MAG: hypothetical protein AAFX06_11210 [Planctomycetota bacterium]
MRPSYGTLSGFKGNTFTLDNVMPANLSDELQENKKNVVVTSDGGNLKVSPAGKGASDVGMWVNYAPTKATFGLAEGGQTWAASGPFSGCQIVIGNKGGRVCVTHISLESGSDGPEAWRGRGWNDFDIWASWKVSMPEGFSGINGGASHVFIDWSAGQTPSAIKIARIDVSCTAMGGSNGEIFKITDMA